MTTEIDHLRLQLPAGFEHRAQRIGRLVGEALAGRDDLGFGRVDQLRVGPVQVEADHSDRRIAHQIADAIQRGLAANRP
ncbi:hypothetical protein Despr_3270 [Desulfobulbus propionicus DSM 2032]|uniref:Uncharacterized protein n=1 Tax=Desulfobulbus propionicus (strain ATCC 33891 / DSM 2032 / VKM B-1956 / 1pr3) TaxID=577650 RepID=A0A7U3YPX3_DESPD|nr:hypothetical protein [Desulfobulbus propionicus]ADW19397.1 hypothetical protein Despr_3270 [Desulfobulbus propionicus DSM 2032]